MASRGSDSVIQEHSRQRARTKIVATVGPACGSQEMLERLAANGADVFRINMAHGTREEHQRIVDTVREISQRTRPLGILVDLAGPKIRLGELASEPLVCNTDDELRFVRSETATAANELVSNYDRLIDELREGDTVMLADGTVSLVVTQCQKDVITCRVTNAGEIRSRQGVNLPGAAVSLPAITDRDIDNARWAAQCQADFVSLSFVRKPQEIDQLRSLLRECDWEPLIIAKIEKREAVDDLEAIAKAADGVMVARGDLGVEIDVADVPVVQKSVIATCNRLQIPVIVATQMLDSMQRNPRPTRAEVTDVANAILDGADACMLSGETAVGTYPALVVQLMNRIMLQTEPILAERPIARPQSYEGGVVHPVTRSVVYGAAQIAERLTAKLVVVVTRSGATSIAKSSQRDFVPCVAVSDSEKVMRQATLLWGVSPLRGAPIGDQMELCQFIDQWGIADQTLRSGDRYVVATGTGVAPGAHNLVVVHDVP
ncbi:MAG: pyruvate kinase [Planctomycetales bacterium]|nr:pyruvate kinase [Planctomycetales bacterium]